MFFDFDGDTLSPARGPIGLPGAFVLYDFVCYAMH
jgi:hypothetical protein